MIFQWACMSVAEQIFNHFFAFVQQTNNLNESRNQIICMLNF